ncbi:MAG: tetratricopeptide repeat protein [Hyalangium sp.]|uniref:tetratricopeptide repeat protein n=1 Tax=Hyalangium sp. TaxID=2028555 RepID=UPI00389A7F10
MLLPLILVLAAAPATPPPASEVEPDYLAFLQQAERGINAGQGEALDAHIDIDRLFERISRGVSAPKEFADSFKSGLRSQGMPFGKQLVTARGANASFHLLNVRREAGLTRALFRASSDAGLNYIDLDLERDPKGAVVIVDIYPYIAGEYVSESARHMYLAALADVQQGMLDKLMGKEQEFIKNMPKMQQMQRLLMEKKYQAVLDTFEQLPASMRQQKPVLLVEMTAAEKVSEAEYKRAIATFEKAFPGDPSLDLVSIDGHLLRKDYPAVMSTIDRLDSRVKDPYLKFLRASVMLDKKDLPAAKKYLDEAVHADPHLTQAWFALIGLSLQEKNYAETSRLLTAIERDAGVAVSNLDGVKVYEGFVQSPEGKAWRKKHSQKH